MLLILWNVPLTSTERTRLVCPVDYPSEAKLIDLFTVAILMAALNVISELRHPSGAAAGRRQSRRIAASRAAALA
jgi:hypothetical protein